MNSMEIAHGHATFGDQPGIRKMPAHWLMAHLGKRVLRPGGIETTRWLVDRARIDASDDVIELATGVGATARVLLARDPRSYVGIERDRGAAEYAAKALARAGFPELRVVQADASHVPLPDACASVVVGEAMLSMQAAPQKNAILREVHRLLRPGGRYAIHELGVTGDVSASSLEQLQKQLAQSIHVPVRIGPLAEWSRWLEEAGFEIEAVHSAPMRLLEWDRMLRDEGAFGTARFVFNTLRTPHAAARLRGLRAVFRRYTSELCAVALVARRSPKERHTSQRSDGSARASATASGA